MPQTKWQGMDYTRQFEVYQRVEVGKGEKTVAVAAYSDDVKRFRAWLDTYAVERGLPPSWGEVSARHIRAYTAWLSSERTQERKDGTHSSLKPVGAKYLRRVTSRPAGVVRLSAGYREAADRQLRP